MKPTVGLNSRNRMVFVSEDVDSAWKSETPRSLWRLSAHSSGITRYFVGDVTLVLMAVARICGMHLADI